MTIKVLILIILMAAAGCTKDNATTKPADPPRPAATSAEEEPQYTPPQEVETRPMDRPMQVVQELPRREDGFWNLLKVRNGVRKDGEYWLPVGYLRYFNLKKPEAKTFKEEWYTTREILKGGKLQPGESLYRYERQRHYREFFLVGKSLGVDGYLLLEKFVPEEHGRPDLKAKYGRHFEVPRSGKLERRWYDLKGAPLKIGGLSVSKVEITFGYDSMLFEVHKRGKQVPVDWEGTPLWGSTDPYTARNLFALEVFFRVEPPEDRKSRHLDADYWAVRFSNGAIVYQNAYSAAGSGDGLSWELAEGWSHPSDKYYPSFAKMTFYADYRMEPIEISYYDGEVEFKAAIVRKSDPRTDPRPMTATRDGLVYADD